MSSAFMQAINKGAFEAGLFVTSCVIFKMWIAKRSNQDKNKNFTYISHEKYLSRTEDPEDSSRKFNVYPEEKIVVRFLH